MLQEQIFQALKNAVTDGGKKITSISDRTLNAEALRLSKQITEEANIEAGIVDSVAVLKEFDGNVSAVAAEAARRAKEATPPSPPVPPVSPVNPPAADLDPETKAMLKSILEKQQELDAKQSSAEKAAIHKAKLDAAKEILKTKGAVHAKTLDTTLALHTFDESLTAEQIAEKALPLYNAEYKEFFGDTQPPKTGAPMTDEQKTAQQAEAKRLLEKTRAKIAPPAPKPS